MRLLLTLVTALLLAAMPAGSAGRLVEPMCFAQDAADLHAEVCTPAVPCVDEHVGDGGRVVLCHADATPADADGDGYTVADGDCDDSDPSVNPGAGENPTNGMDDDCDGELDEGGDMDGDGWSIPMDCDDSDSTAFPGAAEHADRRDTDCDGQESPAFQDSGDHDGDGVTLAGGDCDDEDPAAAPGALEIADRKDNDCNGLAEA